MVVRMGTILITNGFTTDLGNNVNDWQTNYQDDDLPALSVCDLVENNSFRTPQTKHTLRELAFQFRVFVASDTPAATMRLYLKDIEEAIRSDVYWTVSGTRLASHTKPLSSGMELDESGFEIVAGYVEVEVAYITALFNAEG